MKKMLLVVWVCIAVAVVLYICNGEQQKVVVVNTPEPAVSQQVHQVADSQVKSDRKDFLDIADISNDMVGKNNIPVVGYIVDLEEKRKGNIFTWVKDLKGEQRLKVILWGKTIKKNPEYRDIFIDCYNSKKPVFLRGMVDVYKGDLELKAFEVYRQ